MLVVDDINCNYTLIGDFISLTYFSFQNTKNACGFALSDEHQGSGWLGDHVSHLVSSQISVHLSAPFFFVYMRPMVLIFASPWLLFFSLESIYCFFSIVIF